MTVNIQKRKTTAGEHLDAAVRAIAEREGTVRPVRIYHDPSVVRSGLGKRRRSVPPGANGR